MAPVETLLAGAAGTPQAVANSPSARGLRAAVMFERRELRSLTIVERLGHAKPSVKLAIEAHMFHTDDSKAAAAIDAAVG